MLQNLIPTHPHSAVHPNLYLTAPISPSTYSSFLSILHFISFSPLLASSCPCIHLLSYLSPSNLRDALENVLWHFLHHLGFISSSSASAPRPLCSILFTHTTIKHYPAGSALRLCLLIASLYSRSPSCTSQNLPAQGRNRYQSTDIPYAVWSL